MRLPSCRLGAPATAMLLALATLAACTGGRDTADGSAGSVPLDASVTARDASAPEPDASASPEDATVAPDAAPAGGPCSFNDDCDPSQHCACSAGACACQVGARGTGVSGVTACADGDDCASALCLEGPGDQLICSSACDDPSDCPPALPRCLSVPFVGSLCARDPATAGDAGVPAGDAGVAGCTGACATTDLMAVLTGGRGPFPRAQHGVVAASGNLRVEAHFGGDPACPEEQSPTPDRTLILIGLTSAMRVQTEADGLRATLLDFRGDLTAAPILRATAVRATPRFVQPGVAVSFELEATFAEGTVSGGFYAEHCASLDE